MIYHITVQKDWERAMASGSYIAASLHTEGFIHSSDAHQIEAVRQRYFKGVTDLILLHIDENKLHVPMKYELAPSLNEMFPHIFGPINLDAVIKTELI